MKFYFKSSLIVLFLLTTLFSINLINSPTRESFSSRSPASSKLAPPLFGPEFTFSNKELDRAATKAGGFVVNTKANESAALKLAESVKERCLKCKVKKIVDKYGLTNYQVAYPDGYYFTIGVDPAVVEITAKPLPYKELLEKEALLAHDLFAAAEAIDLHPHAQNGGGHIHLGLATTFHGDAKLLRNFLVDYYNHPELASGILDDDIENAPHITHLTKKQQRAFLDLIHDFDNTPFSLSKLASRMNEEVYFQTTDLDVANPEKYHSVNLTRITNRDFSIAEKTVELRSIRAQKSPQEFLRLTSLFEKRVEYLKQLESIVPFEKRMPVTLGQQYRNFVRYVEEVGDSPISFATILPLQYDHFIWSDLGRSHPLTPNYLLARLQHHYFDERKEVIELVMKHLEELPTTDFRFNAIKRELLLLTQNQPTLAKKIKSRLARISYREGSAHLNCQELAVIFLR